MFGVAICGAPFKSGSYSPYISISKSFGRLNKKMLSMQYNKKGEEEEMQIKKARVE